MRINPKEHRFFKKFHQEFFKPYNYAKGIKPDIEGFVKKNRVMIGNMNIGELKTKLALYVFNFWCLAYVIKNPSKEIIESKFKQYS